MKKLLIFAALLGVSAIVPVNAALVTFSVIPPGGTVTGTPGSTVGWGFQLTVDPAANRWVQVTNTDFCVGAVVSPCTPLLAGGQTVGTYTDFAGLNGVVASSAAGVGESFNRFLMTGVGQFAIAASAPVGNYAGKLVLTYDSFTTDPNGPNFDPFAAGNQFGQTATATAAVTVGFVPEPATGVVVLSGLGLLAAMGRRSRRAA